MVRKSPGGCLREGSTIRKRKQTRNFYKFEGSGGLGQGEFRGCLGGECRLLKTANTLVENRYFEDRGVSWGVLGVPRGGCRPLENAKSLVCFIHFNDRGGQWSPRGASGRGGRPERHTVSHFLLSFFSFAVVVIWCFLSSFHFFRYLMLVLFLTFFRYFRFLYFCCCFCCFLGFWGFWSS